MIDTPEGIAFFRALALQGRARLRVRGAIADLKRIYGYTGSPASVRQMHDEYVEALVEIRGWSSERGTRAQDIAQEAIRRAEEEHGDTYTKATLDSNVQAFFESGSITEDEGNDACLLIFVAVIDANAARKRENA